MKSQHATKKLNKLLTSPLAEQVLEYLKQLKSGEIKPTYPCSYGAYLNFRSKP